MSITLDKKVAEILRTSHLLEKSMALSILKEQMPFYSLRSYTLLLFHHVLGRERETVSSIQPTICLLSSIADYEMKCKLQVSDNFFRHRYIESILHQSLLEIQLIHRAYVYRSILWKIPKRKRWRYTSVISFFCCSSLKHSLANAYWQHLQKKYY